MSEYLKPTGFPRPPTNSPSAEPVGEKLEALRNAPEPKISREPGVEAKIKEIREGLRGLIPRRSAVEEGVEEGEVTISSIDEELRKALEKGPSSLISEEVIRRLAGIIGVTTTAAARVSLRAWLLNPRAAAKVLGAIAEEATAQAGVRKAVSETARWLAETAGDDVRRDALLNYIENLEEALGPYVKLFCEERNLPLPKKGT